MAKQITKGISWTPHDNTSSYYHSVSTCLMTWHNFPGLEFSSKFHGWDYHSCNYHHTKKYKELTTANTQRRRRRRSKNINSIYKVQWVLHNPSMAAWNGFDEFNAWWSKRERDGWDNSPPSPDPFVDTTDWSSKMFQDRYRGQGTRMHLPDEKVQEHARIQAGPWPGDENGVVLEIILCK